MVSATRITRLAWLLCLPAAWLASATPVAGHHSFAMYDLKEVRTLTGRLTRFVPGANHAQLLFELLGPDGQTVIAEDGRPVTWGVETGPAAELAKRGITVESFPVGTVFTVDLNPLRDGRPFGVLARGAERLIKCGSTLPSEGCTAATGELYLDLGN